MGDPKRLGSGPWFRHSGAPVKVTHELVNIVIPKLDEPRVPVEEGPEGLARLAITLGLGVFGRTFGSSRGSHLAGENGRFSPARA